MKRTFISILLLIFIFSCNNSKQENVQVQIDIKDCNYLENYYWIKETFEKNDAGFEWAIEKKSKETYQRFCDSIELELKNARDIYECERILNDWGKFFRKGHIYIKLNETSSKTDASISTEKVNYSVETVEMQIKQINDPMVGFWESSPYKIGIVLDTLNINRKYVGFIIESTVPEWTKGDVKLEIFDNTNCLTSNFYMQNHSIEKRDVELRSETELMIGTMRFINHLKIESEIEKKLLDISKPTFCKLSNHTTLLKIPSFNLNQKSAIDKEIKENKQAIQSHKNLIIDLRNNGGGSDNSWKELVPFIYTNSIKNIGVEYFSTKLNREYLLQNTSFIQKLFSRKFFKNLEANNGKFVVRDSVYITELDTVLPNPSNVIVLVDENCASSVEQFLFVVKQSKKVKIYGKQTFGALDVSNVTNVLSPDGCFRLGYCTTRTLRLPKDRIDDIGIKPDIEINDSIPKQKWIEFILKNIDK